MRTEDRGRGLEPAVTAGPGRRVLRSEDLMRGAREVVIRHDGQEYRLQVTRNGKLILVK